MDNNKNIRVICQCLSVLNLPKQRFFWDDHRTHKLYSGRAIGLHVLAQLLQLKSYDDITEQLQAHPELGQILGMSSVSGPQLSRKTKALCTDTLQDLFYHLIGQIQERTKDGKGFSPSIGRLHLIDATDIRLPDLLGSWARCGSRKTGVRLHVRLVVADPDTVFPDKVIASTVNVREAKVSLQLTLEDDVTYVMDRGYEKSEHVEKWLTDGIQFVVRVRDLLQLHPVPGTERTIPSSESAQTRILQDVDVLTNKTTKPARLVAFADETGRQYRVLTSRWDLTADEIALIYKNRWRIELFFKWVKQHLKLVKLHGSHPDGVWNQLFLSLIAFAVSLLLKLNLQTPKTQWQVLKLVRTYMYKMWEELENAVFRPPTRKSRGRQKVNGFGPSCKLPQRIILL